MVNKFNVYPKRDGTCEITNNTTRAAIGKKKCWKPLNLRWTYLLTHTCNGESIWFPFSPIALRVTCRTLYACSDLNIWTFPSNTSRNTWNPAERFGKHYCSAHHADVFDFDWTITTSADMLASRKKKIQSFLMFWSPHPRTPRMRLSFLVCTCLCPYRSNSTVIVVKPSRCIIIYVRA